MILIFWIFLQTLEMQNQIIARLQQLSEERKARNIPEKNAQIEKWLKGVEKYAHHWNKNASPVYKRVEQGAQTQGPCWERGDSGFDSISAISTGTQVLRNQGKNVFATFFSCDQDDITK